MYAIFVYSFRHNNLQRWTFEFYEIDNPPKVFHKIQNVLLALSANNRLLALLKKYGI